MLRVAKARAAGAHTHKTGGALPRSPLYLLVRALPLPAEGMALCVCVYASISLSLSRYCVCKLYGRVSRPLCQLYVFLFSACHAGNKSVAARSARRRGGVFFLCHSPGFDLIPSPLH